jgi:transcriptional regulator with XRE-family HTH domain
MDLGQRIRERRKQLGLSLRQLAGEAGLTASFLSQVERGLASPSIDSLRAISRALDVPMFYFLLEPNDHNPVIRHDQRRKLVIPQTGITYELLSPINRKMEVVLTKLDPEDGNVPIMHYQNTEECIFVLEGELEVGLVDERHVLQAGDSIYFEGPMLRDLTARGSQTVRYLSMITPPIF